MALSLDNTTLTVTFNNDVFNTNTGEGAIEKEDFNLNIFNGNSTLVSSTPTSLSGTGKIYDLTLKLLVFQMVKRF